MSERHLLATGGEAKGRLRLDNTPFGCEKVRVPRTTSGIHHQGSHSRSRRGPRSTSGHKRAGTGLQTGREQVPGRGSGATEVNDQGSRTVGRRRVAALSVLQISMTHPWRPDDLPLPVDSGAPADIITTESLGSQADHLEQAVIAFKRAFTTDLRREHPLTAALRYLERKSGTSLGLPSPIPAAECRKSRT